MSGIRKGIKRLCLKISFRRLAKHELAGKQVNLSIVCDLFTLLTHQVVTPVGLSLSIPETFLSIHPPSGSGVEGMVRFRFTVFESFHMQVNVCETEHMM